MSVYLLRIIGETMEISIFEVTGPVMVGPSSSHTAGAAKLSRIASMITNKGFNHVSFGLYGSFAKTYQGHGTDKALVAGILGICQDDKRLADAFHLAKKAGVTYDFYEIELVGVHENSVKMTFQYHKDNPYEIIGSSIGGGQIVISEIGGFKTEFTAQSSCLIITQKDIKGVISHVSGVLAKHNINIGSMKVSRKAKGDIAFCIIEID